MNDSVITERFQYENDRTITIKLPTHCPPPPVIKVPQVVVPCLEASAKASKISSTIAHIDGKKADHEWHDALKNTNYKMLAKATTCSNNVPFPCDETVLAHHPSQAMGSLHCFTETTEQADISVDHDCFKGALLKEYYIEYKNFLEQLAIKWTKLLGLEVWPGEKCFSYQAIAAGVDTHAYDNLNDFFAACEANKLVTDGTRNDERICGSSHCCNNYDAETLPCADKRVDTTRGYWKYEIHGGNCTGDLCTIEDLKLDIKFHFNGKTDVIDVQAENRTFVGLSVADILTKLIAKGNDPKDFCKANSTPEGPCGLNHVVPGQEFHSGHLHYCMPDECCVKEGKTIYEKDASGNYVYENGKKKKFSSHQYVCKPPVGIAGTQCPENHYKHFDYEFWSSCMHRNTQSTQGKDSAQIEILAGKTTEYGKNMDVRDGEALLADGTSDDSEVIIN